MIVHEAWMKLSKDGRHRFVDHARRKLADKRGSGTKRVDLDEVVIIGEDPEPVRNGLQLKERAEFRPQSICKAA